MPVRKRPLNRHEASLLFERIHATQLAHAHEVLARMGKYARWRIALQEELPVCFVDDTSPCATITCIDVKLTWDGKRLEIADIASERAIEEWEERHAASGRQTCTSSLW